MRFTKLSMQELRRNIESKDHVRRFGCFAPDFMSSEAFKPFTQDDINRVQDAVTRNNIGFALTLVNDWLPSAEYKLSGGKNAVLVEVRCPDNRVLCKASAEAGSEAIAIISALTGAVEAACDKTDPSAKQGAA